MDWLIHIAIKDLRNIVRLVMTMKSNEMGAHRDDTLSRNVECANESDAMDANCIEVVFEFTTSV